MLTAAPPSNQGQQVGEMRRVVNAQCIIKGVSHNSSLLIGPPLLTSLTGVVMRFPEDQNVISTDIEAIFQHNFFETEDQRFYKHYGRTITTSLSSTSILASSLVQLIQIVLPATLDIMEQRQRRQTPLFISNRRRTSIGRTATEPSQRLSKKSD